MKRTFTESGTYTEIIRSLRRIQLNRYFERISKETFWIPQVKILKEVLRWLKIQN